MLTLKLRPQRKTDRHSQLRRWSWVALLSIGFSCVWLTMTERSWGSEPAWQEKNHDLHHTIAVRQALLRDPELASLNLGVKMDNRVAHLWGPVPSLRLLHKAVQLVQQLPDVLRVYSELHVEDPETMEPLYLPNPVPQPVPPPAVRPMEIKPPPVVPFGPPVAPTPTTPSLTPPASGKWEATLAKQGTPQWQPGFPSTDETIRYKPRITESTNDGGVAVLPPIRITNQGPNQPLNIEWANAAVQQRVQQLHKSDDRFRTLQVELRGAQVHLRGSALRWDDVYELAKAISKVPGVERIIIGDVQVVSGR